MRVSRRSSTMSSPDRVPEFFKVYLPDHSSQQLKIPPAFLKYFNGVLPKKSILTLPTKRLWHVNVEKVNNSLFFKDGWQLFVEDNSLEFGDFLIFSYVSPSRFDVKIYCKSGCEKEVSLESAMQRGKRKDRKEFDDVKGIDKSACGSEGNGIKAEETKEIHIIDIDCIDEETGHTSSPTARDYCGLVQPNHEPRKFQRLTGKISGVKQRSIEERDEALKAASKYDFKYPHFKVVMCSNYVGNSTLNIPSSFIRNHMNLIERQIVTLWCTDRSWSVQLNTYTYHSRRSHSSKLSKGWNQFVKENNLQIGDVCVFEVPQKNHLVFKVSIIRSLNGMASLPSS